MCVRSRWESRSLAKPARAGSSCHSSEATRWLHVARSESHSALGPQCTLPQKHMHTAQSLCAWKGWVGAHNTKQARLNFYPALLVSSFSPFKKTLIDACASPASARAVLQRTKSLQPQVRKHTFAFPSVHQSHAPRATPKSLERPDRVPAQAEASDILSSQRAESSGFKRWAMPPH